MILFRGVLAGTILSFKWWSPDVWSINIKSHLKFQEAWNSFGFGFGPIYRGSGSVSVVFSMGELQNSAGSPEKWGPPLEETSTQSSNFLGFHVSFRGRWLQHFVNDVFFWINTLTTFEILLFFGGPEVILVRNLWGWKRWSLYFWNIQSFWFPAIIYCQEAEASFKMVFG